MLKPITIVEHSGDGTGVKIEALGFTGNACEKATAAIEESLGIVTNRQHKPEYKRSVAVHASATQKA